MAGVNGRNAFRQGDDTGVPLQFKYEEADCRIFYTPAMVVDQTAVWKTVADAAWGDGGGCVAGGLQGGGAGYGGGEKGKREMGGKSSTKMHGVRKDVDISEHFAGMKLRTDWKEKGKGIGDCVMLG